MKSRSRRNRSRLYLVAMNEKDACAIYAALKRPARVPWMKPITPNLQGLLNAYIIDPDSE